MLQTALYAVFIIDLARQWVQLFLALTRLTKIVKTYNAFIIAFVYEKLGYLYKQGKIWRVRWFRTGFELEV